MKKICSLLIIMIVGVSVVRGDFLKGDNTEYKLRVGVSDDTSSLVINHMLENEYIKDITLENFVEKYSVSDC